ncbi:AraC family transcriptional regulator [Marinobacterium mangrovicola]|uniref:AraC family transcriptional regulator n=2 Tax=Marinobacterium mangrovicola TaxID=1476959 RepID=A0A4R1HB63_9GAMM|nr:AraC family transcriptional regulator [Marinobacterium mangrovicola]
MTFSSSCFDQELMDVSAFEISNFLKSKSFADHRLIQRGSRSANVSSLRYKAFGPLQIAEYSSGSSMEVRIPNLDDAYHLQIVLSGEGHCVFDGTSLPIQAGDSIMLTPGTEYTLGYSRDCVQLSVRIPLEFLHQSAREFGYFTAGGPIRFIPRGVNVINEGPIRHLLRDVLEFDVRNTSERAQLYYAKLLCHGILQSHESGICLNDRVNPSEHRHIAQIRNYVLDHLTEDIGIGDLVELCRISRKSLYNLFEKETGQTPSTYIRQLKLETIYSELSGDDRNIRNVTEVALKYGFTNLGRFSAQYREHIGELPSETLRRQSH